MAFPRGLLTVWRNSQALVAARTAVARYDAPETGGRSAHWGAWTLFGLLLILGSHGDAESVAATDGVDSTTAAGPATVNPDSSPEHLVALGDDLILVADDGVHGRELWRYRPQTGDLDLVRDIYPGPKGSSPTDFVRAGNSIYFLASDGIQEAQLWRTGGTEESTDTIRVGGNTDWKPKHLKEAFGHLVFHAEGPDHNRRLWRTNDTPWGAIVMQAPSHGRYGLYPGKGEECGRFYYFWADEMLWQTDGTPVGTRQTTVTFPEEVTGFDHLLQAVNGKLLTKATTLKTGEELWVFDPAGQSKQWRLLQDICTGTGDSNPQQYMMFKGNLYFQAHDPEHGAELWKTDGTPEGTALAADLVRGPAGGFPQYFAVAEDLMYFSATDPDHGRELWVTDGTTDGTHMVKDVVPGQADGTPFQLTPFGRKLFYSTENLDYGEELWLSDGTEQGTRMVKDINPGKASGEPYNFTVLNKVLYFSAKDGVHGEELWSSDGTESGTRLVEDINVPVGAIASSNPSRLTELNGKLLFFARNRQGHYILYSSTGLPNSTMPLESPIPPQLDPENVHLVSDDGWLYLLLSNGDATGGALWKTDGTSKGTSKLDDVPEGAVAKMGPGLAVTNGAVYYAKRDDAHGIELWTCPAQTGAPRLAADVNAGPASSEPHELTAWKGYVYFAANDAAHGVELWRVGKEGPELVTDIAPGALSSRPESLVATESYLYFTADDATHGRELWRTDGTAAGTISLGDILPGPAGAMPRNLTVADKTLFFTANDGAHGFELWKTDGSAQGTQLVCDIFPGRASSAPAWLTSIDNLVYFSADDGVRGVELWRSDGSVSGTFRVGDAVAGAPGSGPSHLRAINGDLYFSAFDPHYGREPWIYHGRLQQAPFRDICAGTGDSNPSEFCAAGEKVFFRADNGVQGMELWSTEFSGDMASKTHLVSDILKTNPVRAKVVPRSGM